ncbi:MAG: hypothetical protein ABFD64_06110 [Armatimonadota bacterium]
MKRTAFVVLAVILAFGIIMVSGCKNNDRTKISSILNAPGKYVDHKVIVAGEVTKCYGVDLLITEAGAYQLDDGTGKIWIITKNGVPREGAKVGLKGTVSSGFKLGRDVFGAVIQETERRTR